MTSSVLTEDQAFELLTFLVTSARLCLDEPQYYGSFRLIDAASRMMSLMLDGDAVADREFYQRLRRDIEDRKALIMYDQEAYAALLKDAAREVGRHLRTRSGAGAVKQ
jgi:Family of unknown function (DUF6092)